MHKADLKSSDLSTDKTSESKNNFRYFYKFMANNEVYLVPKDHDQYESVCVSDTLLNAIMKAN